MALRGYWELDVYVKAKELCREVGGITKKLPKDERFALADQMRRAAASISSNISEGYGRGSRKEYINFLHIAQGSTCELQTQLLLCVELGYVSKTDVKQARSLAYDVGRMLCRMIASLKATPGEAGREGKIE